ncbi:TPA: hypothetical protein ACQVKS_000908 [Serratia marcescens]|uniref:hypothetical protein n=1 Tax=Serratia nevei TaxID=2703794 RepID=UPI00254AD6EE|nr:hypothetical protein [Serratia nevei]MDK5298552.1 hypothetical protein [Serratia nevei]MEC5887196.1 hypothetical protein [Serratia nevei]
MKKRWVKSQKNNIGGYKFKKVGKVGKDNGKAFTDNLFQGFQRLSKVGKGWTKGWILDK